MSDDFQAASFREVIQALQRSTEVMTVVSEKIVSLEKSLDRLDENVEELLKLLKNGRLAAIENALKEHDQKRENCSATCMNSFSSVMEGLIRDEAKILLNSDAVKKVFVAAIKGQLDPSDPEHLTPVAVKQQIKGFEWREWINGRVLVVAGSLFAIFELVMKFLILK